MKTTLARRGRRTSLAAFAVAAAFAGTLVLSAAPSEAARKPAPSPTPTQTTVPTFPAPEPTKTYPAGWQPTEPGIDPQN